MEKNQVYIIHMDISSQGVSSRKLYLEKGGKVSLDRHIQTHQHLDRVPDGEILSRGNSNSYSMSFELIAILVSLWKEISTVHIHAPNGIYDNFFQLETTCSLLHGANPMSIFNPEAWMVLYLGDYLQISSCTV